MPLTPDSAVAFAQLSQELAAEEGLGSTVERVVQLAQLAIPGCDLAGFTVAHPDQLESAATTDPIVEELDSAQHRFGEGPCLDSSRTEDTHVIRETASESRWPQWCAEAVRLGVHSVLSVQLSGPSKLRAALNLYSKAPDAFDDDAVITAEIYAAHAGNAIAATSAMQHLQTALQTRHGIGVAQGMLMMRYGLDEGQAFNFLARQSQQTNTKLREVALKVVAQLAQERWPAGG